LDTGCDEPLSTREAVAIETPARRLMSASDAMDVRRTLTERVARD
jgi:hypothetical protein